MAGTVGRVGALRLAREVAPVLSRYAAEVDEAARFPVESMNALRASGLLGLLVPAEEGGLGGDLGDMVEIAQVLASSCLSTATIWAMHCQQVDAVVRFGSAPLRQKLLPRIASGAVYLASVTTERGTGGHLLTAGAALKASEDTIVIERDAPIVTGGEHADGFLITMRDASDASANRVTLVYADREQLSLNGFGAWNPLGMRGTHSVGMRLFGSVPEDQVVGARGEYRMVAVESVIPCAHLGWAACWLGTARTAFADVIALIRSPRRPRSVDPSAPLVATRLARARADLELVNAYLMRTKDEVLALRADSRTLDAPATQIHLNTLKVVAAELTFRAVDTLIQLTGLATGYLRTSAVPLERHFRDLRSASLNYANDRLLTANGALALLDRDVQLM